MRSIWRIHAGTPSPIPGWNRPGCARAVVAISIASNAGWRTPAETTPRPTCIASVAPRAMFAPDNPPVKKKSSASQSSENPASSACRADEARCSGPTELPITSPTVPDIILQALDDTIL